MNTSKTRAKTASVFSTSNGGGGITRQTETDELLWNDTKNQFLHPRRKNEHPLNLVTFPTFPATVEPHKGQWLPPTLPVPKSSHSAKRFAKSSIPSPLVNLSSIPPINANMSPTLPSKLSSRFIRHNRYNSYKRQPQPNDNSGGETGGNGKSNFSHANKEDDDDDGVGGGGGGGGGRKSGMTLKSNLKKDNQNYRPNKQQGGKNNNNSEMEKTLLTISDIKKPTAEGKSLLDHPTSLDPNSIRLIPVPSLNPGKSGGKSGTSSSSNGLIGERMQVIRTEEEKLRNPDSIRLDKCGLKQFPLISHTAEPNLRLLSLQHNLITRLETVPSLNHLVVLDLYNNRIDRISGKGLNSLRVLLLGKNRIRRIEGIEGLKRLEVLDLHGNQLRYVDNLGCLMALRVLNLAGNNFKTIRLGSYSLLSLVELNLKRNRIRNLEGLQKAPHLKKLLLANNELSSTSCLYPLRKLVFLQEVLFEPNPLCSSPDYVNQVLSVFPWLEILDRSQVTDVMRTEAKIWNRKRLAEEEAKKNEQAKLNRPPPPTSREEIIHEARRRWQSVKNFVKNKDQSNNNNNEGQNDHESPGTEGNNNTNSKKNQTIQAQLHRLFDLDGQKNLNCANFDRLPPPPQNHRSSNIRDEKQKNIIINQVNNTKNFNISPEIQNTPSLLVTPPPSKSVEREPPSSLQLGEVVSSSSLPKNEISAQKVDDDDQVAKNPQQDPVLVASREKSQSKIAIVRPLIRSPVQDEEDGCISINNKIDVDEEKMEQFSTKSSNKIERISDNLQQEEQLYHKNKSSNLSKQQQQQVYSNNRKKEKSVEQMRKFILQQQQPFGEDEDAIEEVEEEDNYISDHSNSSMIKGLANQLQQQQKHQQKQQEEDEEEENYGCEDKFEVVQQNDADFMDKTTFQSSDLLLDEKQVSRNYNSNLKNLNLMINQSLSTKTTTLAENLNLDFPNNGGTQTLEDGLNNNTNNNENPLLLLLNNNNVENNCDQQNLITEQPVANEESSSSHDSKMMAAAEKPERGPLKRSMSSFSLGPPAPIPNLGRMSSSNSAQNINKLIVPNSNNNLKNSEQTPPSSNKHKLASLKACHRSASFDVRFPSSESDSSSDDNSSVLTMNASECGTGGGGRGSRKFFPRNKSRLKRDRLTSSKLQTNNGGLNSSGRRPLTGIRGDMSRSTNPHRPLKRCDSAVSDLPSSINLTAAMKKQGADFLVEIDGKILNVYGQGALKYTLMGFPTSLTSNVTTAKFHYISYDTIIPYFGKLRQIYPSLEHINFRANNISTLAQLNALADLQGLTSLHVAKEGNPLVSNELWPNYASYRLSHWGLQNINRQEVTSEYRGSGGGGSLTTSTKAFESLGYVALSCLPQTALTPLAKRLHTLHCFCCCSPSSSSDDSGRRKNVQNGGTNEPSGNPCTSWDDDPVLLDVIGKEALVYAPPLHDKEKQAERAEIPEKILNSGVEILEKLDLLEKSWPSLLSELVQDILMDYLLLDNNYMKKEFKKVQDLALISKK